MENKEKKYEFEKDSFILFILMMTANVINYVFQIVMGRLFNVAEYGELNSLFAIFTLVSLPMNALTLVVAKYVTSYTARGLQGQALGFIKKFFFYILFISVVLVVLGSTISPWLAGFIRTEDTVAIVFLFIVAGMATSTAIVTGSLQGLQKFFDYGLVNIINPLIKLVGSIFLVLLGLKINGVLGAMLMGNFVLLFLGYFILKKHFRSVQIAKVEIDKKDIFKYFINPTGRFVIGGPLGDSGLTGRKIIVDTYGGAARHGGGAFSGKDPTKVDRSASYMARHIAKNIVANGYAKKCEIQIAYSIGVAKPVSIYVNTYGTNTIPEEEIVEKIDKTFDLTPRGIINYLDLQRPIYRQTTNYGHFGKKDLPWEKIINF